MAKEENYNCTLFTGKYPPLRCAKMQFLTPGASHETIFLFGIWNMLHLSYIALMYCTEMLPWWYEWKFHSCIALQAYFSVSPPAQLYIDFKCFSIVIKMGCWLFGEKSCVGKCPHMTKKQLRALPKCQMKSAKYFYCQPESSGGVWLWKSGFLGILGPGWKRKNAPTLQSARQVWFRNCAIRSHHFGTT